jgi:adhesin transport system outer membrane protein
VRTIMRIGLSLAMPVSAGKYQVPSAHQGRQSQFRSKPQANLGAIPRQKPAKHVLSFSFLDAQGLGLKNKNTDPTPGSRARRLAVATVAKKSRGLLMALLAALPVAASAGTLDQLIIAALQAHPAIQVQQAQADAAQSGADSARWQFFPTPSISAEAVAATSGEPSSSSDSWAGTISLQQPLWTGGKLSSGREKADANLSASDASLEEARQQIALRVVQSYGDWLAAHIKMQAYEKSLAVHTRLRDQIQRRIEQGASANSDLTLAVSRLEAVAADNALARAQKDIALARLGQLLGSEIDDTELAAALAQPRPIGANIKTLLAQAQAASPALQKASAQVQVQDAVIKERRADLMPELYLRAERQFSNDDNINAGAENRLFLGLSSNFGAGLSSYANVKGAKAQQQAAVAEAQAQSRAINEQVLSDYALASLASQRLSALNESLGAARQVAESYDRQFLAGRKTWQDVMNAARELSQTEVQLADSTASQVVTTWRLMITTQGLSLLLETPP